METTTQNKIDYLKETKSLMKTMLNNHGASITDTTPFRQYVNILQGLMPHNLKDAILENNVVNEPLEDVWASVPEVADLGLFKGEDNLGTTYYFRGMPEKNYLKFADKWWRIMRINGNGSIRIIYDGNTPSSQNDTNSHYAFSSTINDSEMDCAYMGYVYGTPSTYKETPWIIKHGLYQCENISGQTLSINPNNMKSYRTECKNFAKDNAEATITDDSGNVIEYRAPFIKTTNDGHFDMIYHTEGTTEYLELRGFDTLLARINISNSTDFTTLTEITIPSDKEYKVSWKSTKTSWWGSSLITSENNLYSSYIGTSSYYYADDYTFDPLLGYFVGPTNRVYGKVNETYIGKFKFAVSSYRGWYCMEKLIEHDTVNTNYYLVERYTVAIDEASTYEETFDNTTDSVMKKNVDKWYNNNLKQYENLLDNESGFICDRTIYSGNGFGNGSTTFNVSRRMNRNEQPTFKSLRDKDWLKLYIGLPSADEITFAGVYNTGYSSKDENNLCYLSTKNDRRTLSPDTYSISQGTTYMLFALSTYRPYSDLSTHRITNSYDVCPVVNLKANVMVRGEGTIDNPYVVVTES